MKPEGDSKRLKTQLFKIYQNLAQLMFASVPFETIFDSYELDELFVKNKKPN